MIGLNHFAIRLISLYFFLFVSTISFAQEIDIQLKDINDTILNTKRTLKTNDPLNAETAMLKLFSGKLYKMTGKPIVKISNAK